MKRHSRTAWGAPVAGAAAMLFGSAFAHADTIALNWLDTTGNNGNTGYSYVANYTDPSNVSLTTSDVVGAPGAATAGWQNTPDNTSYTVAGAGYIKAGNIPTMTLTNTAGQLTSATLTVDPSSSSLNGVDTLSDSGSWNNSQTPNDTYLPTATDRLYNSILLLQGGRTTELALQNIPSSYSSYNIYVYLSYDTYQSGSIQLFEGGTVGGAQNPLYFSNGMGWVPLNQYGGYPDSGYTQITSTDSTNPTTAGNSAAYVEFTGLTGSAQTIDLLGGSGGVAGIEIVSAAVPEPASLSLLALGAGGLLARRRRGA